MRRLLPGLVLSAGLLAFSAPTGRACLWDREVENQEREFKSNYLNQPATPAPATEESPYSPTDRWEILAASGLGVALLLGAAFISLGGLPNRESAEQSQPRRPSAGPKGY